MQKLIVILGQTATGKTDLVIKLAQELNGEIISADSRQIYQELNIGTAKPTKKELQGIFCHLIDFVKPDQDFNVALYKKEVIRIIKGIKDRGKLPFLVGGTGLYLRAITENISFSIPPQLSLRRKLENQTNEQLFKIYQELDSKGALLIDRKNKRRLVRAIEVCQVTGKPFWAQRQQKSSLFDIFKIGLELSSDKLEKRIKARVHQMVEQGLEQEVKLLVKKYGWNAPALQSIGYQEWRDYWEGNINKDELIDLIILRTKQFSKRQMTWFKRDSDIYWIDSWANNYQKIKKKIKNFIL